MKIIKKYLVVFLLIGSISIISCGDDSSDDDPDTYITIEKVDGSFSKTYKAGFSDKTGGKPFSYTSGGGISYLAFPISINKSGYASGSTTRISIVYSNNIGAGTYNVASDALSIRVLYDSEVNGGATLSSPSTASLTVTEYGDYNKGTFTFTGNDSVNYKGSFVVKHVSDPFI